MLWVAAIESDRHTKWKRVHTAATFVAANLNHGDRDISTGHVSNHLLFIGDGALGEVFSLGDPG